MQKIITAEDDEQFLRRAKNTRWIESSLQASLPNVSLDEGIGCLLDYLLTKHGDVTREKLRDLGVLPKKMNAYEMAATMKESKIGISQWRSLVKCVKTYSGIADFSESERTWRRLGTDHGPIESGKFHYHRKLKKVFIFSLRPKP